MNEYLIRFISKRVKDIRIRNKCICEIKENKQISESWFIINDYKFNKTQLGLISEYNYNCIKNFNY